MADHDESDDDIPKPFWSGVVTCGLVSLPVSLFPATRKLPAPEDGRRTADFSAKWRPCIDALSRHLSARRAPG